MTGSLLSERFAEKARELFAPRYDILAHCPRCHSVVFSDIRTPVSQWYCPNCEAVVSEGSETREET